MRLQLFQDILYSPKQDRDISFSDPSSVQRPNCLLAGWKKIIKKNNLIMIVHIIFPLVSCTQSEISRNYIPVVFSVSLLHHRSSLLLCDINTLSGSHSIRYSRACFHPARSTGLGTHKDILTCSLKAALLLFHSLTQARDRRAPG